MPASSWLSWKKSLVCKSEPGEVHDPQQQQQAINNNHHHGGGAAAAAATAAHVVAAAEAPPPASKAHAASAHAAAEAAVFHVSSRSRLYYRSGCSRSIANLRDVINGSSRRIDRTPANFSSPRSLESNDFVHSTASAAHQAILRGEPYHDPSAPPKLSLDYHDPDFSPSYGLISSGPGYSNGSTSPYMPSSRYSRSQYYGTPLHHLFPSQTSTPVRNVHSSKAASNNNNVSSSNSSSSSSLKRLSGCYDCKNPAVSLAVYKTSGSASNSSNGGAASSPPLPPVAKPVCHRCGDVFPRYDALQQHHLLKHAVTELEVGDSSRNVVEIIFRTSWWAGGPEQKRSSGGMGPPAPVRIERVLKVNNLGKTLAKFEDYREGVKARAAKLQPGSSSKKHPRCLADGNELLRFYGATLECGLPPASPTDPNVPGPSSAACASATCSVCRIIRAGFSAVMTDAGRRGVLTTASSGRAHRALLDETAHVAGPSSSAMLVCRVIAGRVHKALHVSGDLGPPSPPSAGFDSVAGGETTAGAATASAAGGSGLHSKFEELTVFNPRAILPCFVVIYRC